jgi:phosphoenolpyruvate synthase/pyruvate phosphate dikinase
LSQEEAAFRIATFQEIIDQEAIISDKNVKPLVVAGGLAGGVMAGPIALSLEKAREFMGQGQNANLVLETTPAREDKSYYPSSRNVKLGVITKHGGKTQHFSIWANKFHMPYISMVNDIKIDPEGQKVKLGGKWFKEGDLITVDGYRGLIFEGDVIQKKEAEISSPVDLDASQQKSSDLGGIDLSQVNTTFDPAIGSQDVLPLNLYEFDLDRFEGFSPIIIGAESPRPLFELMK